MSCSLLYNCSNRVAMDPEFVLRPIVTLLLGRVEKHILSTRVFIFVTRN